MMTLKQMFGRYLRDSLHRMSIVLVCASACALVVWAFKRSPSYRPPPVSYSGDSSGLKDTVIVPTLDSPSPKGKNVIWCGTFELAWNALRDDVVNTPLNVKGIEEVAARLNASKLSQADLPEGDFYVAAGRASDGIAAKIRSDMASLFPDTSLSPFDQGLTPRDILAFAYLKTAVKFDIPYFDQKRGTRFTDSSGRQSHVSSFGLFETSGEVPANERLAEQIEILYATEDEAKDGLKEFALDLCRTSAPNRLVLAVVEPGSTLVETIASLEGKIAGWKPEKREKSFRFLDRLEAPNLNWKIEHRFADMEGTDKALLNPGFEGLWLARAYQMIEFRLDRSGAAVASESNIVFKSRPRRFALDRPFLIVLSKRASGRPFFAMWVDNAELLCKAGGS